MAARAIWKGELKLGTNKVPVKLYSAVEDKGVRFHILDDTKRNRVKQHMVDAESGEEVETKDIRKGYEIEPGKFVILEEDELEGLKPEPSREIEVSEFVPADEIPQQFYERPYFLGPDGDEKSYFALAAALEKQQREGIARWVMRNKTYTGALGGVDGYLVLSTLRNAGEVIAASELPEVTGRAPTKKEIDLAKHLVSMLEGEFDPKEFKDEYRERVLEFIAKKAKGRAPRLAPVKTKRATTSLDSVLAKSIASLKKGKRAA
jgi:DNA end-binding protein Ku